MSGGRLVVLDRAGRDVKRFSLAEGLATLGSDPACDIRIMLPTVSPHHATVVVHANQTVVRNVCEDDTLVNGRCVSVAALCHGDVISIGGRHLRWEYSDPTVRRPQAPEPALYVPRRGGRGGRGGRRGSGPAGAAAREPALQLAIEMSHRASMPGNAGGKQVAIVQPQRRDTSDQIDKSPPRALLQANKRPRTSKSDLDTSANDAENENTKRKSNARVSPKDSLSNLQNTTKATLWIESRKTSPRRLNKIQTPTQEQVLRARRTTASAKKSTPLRLTVLKRAQSAQKMKVTKIEGPLKMDHTKQAAIRLMTGHTSKPKLSSPYTSARSPSFVVKKPSPLRRSSPRSRNTRATAGNTRATAGNTGATAGNTRATAGNTRATAGNTGATAGNTRATAGNTRATAGNTRATAGNTDATAGNTGATAGNTRARRSDADRTVTILEITDSDGRNSSLRNSNTLRRSGQKSPKKSLSTSPRKSALRDPSAKRGTRKTESIKFDLSNLHNHSQDADVLMVTDTTKQSFGADSVSEEDITLHYSESSGVQSPSPRRSIHSRSSKILQHTLNVSPSRTLTPHSPRSTRSSRSGTETLSYSRRTTKSVSDKSQNVTVASAYRTRTLSPRTLRNDLESYSIVDLVSVDTDDTARSTSVYGSAGSTDITAFGTPQNSTRRKTRSTIDPTILGSSTPYVKGRSSTPRSRSNPSPNTSSKTSMNRTKSTIRSSRSRRSKSLLTPENTEDAIKHISVNSTRISRASRSRSRLNDSDLLLLDDDDDSPRTSKRINATSKSTRFSAQTASNDTDVTPTHASAQNEGTCTPENKYSPEEASTPVLSIQSLLDSSQSSLVSQRPKKKVRPSFNTKRNTIGGVTGPKIRIGAKSKSMSFSARKTRLRLSSDSVEMVHHNDVSEVVTPKSAVKLVQEGVKNKHSTAKKPQSKRSIIDDLNESDVVKQLFNSPVKRKLSQSMTEFSRKQLFEDDDVVQDKRPTRNTIALTGRTPDNSLLDHTESYTPEIFVSPISTPTRSPSLEGTKLMLAKTTPENDIRNVRGVKGLQRTSRTRRSIKNDLTNVSGVKNIFTKSPKNRLSDVRVKEVFASSPNNDLRRVTGVKTLFQTMEKRKSPRNELDDLRGVKKLFNTKSPVNDLRNVSGVKRTLRRNSPRDDLSDVRGVKRMFRREKRNDLNDVSGVEELFNLSNYSSGTASTRAESLFDQLVGKPQIKAVYSKTFSTKTAHKTKGRRAKSLHASLDQITGTENWLEQELNKRLQIKNYLESLKSANNSKVNRCKTNTSKLPHASLDEVTDVDVLLEQELDKEQQINNYLESMKSVNDSKTNKSMANKSKLNQSRANKSKTDISKANMSRELQKLVTETVEGDAPIRTSRVRSSTILRSNESDLDRKKSASELYSAHTLPIKKRSLVSASEQSRVLPIKKRVVQHSTPMKGCMHLTLDASALGRVSPITALHTDPNISIRSTQPKDTTEVRSKSARGTKANTGNAPEFVKPSPKKTRGRAKVVNPQPKSASPPREKAATQTKKASPAKAKRDTPAKTKKASSAKAKKASSTKAKKAKLTTPIKKVSPVKAKKPSPAKISASPDPVKTTRSRRKDVLILELNTKKRGATLVIAKKSPLMSPKPKASRKRNEPETTLTPKPSPKKTRATRKNESVKDDKPKIPKNTRAKVQKASVIIGKPSPQLKPRVAKRGQADQCEHETTRRKRKIVTIQEKQPESPKKSQLSSIIRKAEVQPKTRGKKALENESKENVVVDKPGAKTKKGRKTDEPANKKTRNNKQENSAEELKTVRSRDKKVDLQERVESKPKSTRGRRAKTDSIAPEVTTRKRKTSAPDNEIPPKVRKSKELAERGSRRATEVNTETAHTRKKSVAKEGKDKKAPSEAPVKTTRGRKAADVESVKAMKEPEQKTIRGRGRKVNIENVPANQETGKRKRATAAESSPAQERSKKQRGGKKSSIVTTPVRQTRVTRGNAQLEGKPAGRSRRR